MGRVLTTPSLGSDIDGHDRDIAALQRTIQNLSGRFPPKTIPEAAYTPDINDTGCGLLFTNSIPIALMIPAHVFAPGTIIKIIQMAGQITVSGVGGATIFSNGSLMRTNGVGAMTEIWCADINLFIFYGDRV